MSANPYFLNQKDAIVEHQKIVYSGYTFDHTIYGPVFEIRFNNDEYIDFMRSVGSKRLNKFNLVEKIAGSPVLDRTEIIGELLSHNSDFHKAIFIIK